MKKKRVSGERGTTIKALLGHANLITTNKVYIKNIEDKTSGDLFTHSF